MTSYKPPSHSDNFKLLGVTVVGPRPLGIQHVQLREGLNVLYGKNGTGKTRLLAAVPDMLTAKSEEREERGFSDWNGHVLWKMGGIHFSLPMLSEDFSMTQKVRNSSAKFSRDNFAADDTDDLDARAFREKVGYYWKPSKFLESITDWLLTRPWEKRSLNDRGWTDGSVYKAEQGQSGAFKLGLDESQVRWLLENGRWFFEPRTRSLFLCDDQPGSSPLSEIWFKSQQNWAPALKDPHRPEFGKLFWGSSQNGDMEWTFFADDLDTGLCPLFPSLDLPELPPWAAYPVLKVPYNPHWHQDLIDGDDTEKLREIQTKWGPLTDATIQHLESFNNQIWDAEKQQNRTLERGEVFDPKIIIDECERLSESTSQKMATLFEDAPLLRVLKVGNEKISRSAPIQWRAKFPGGNSFPADELGFAHRRYANFVTLQELRKKRTNTIARTVDETRTYYTSWFESQLILRSPSVLIVDEPERGLHPLAAKHLSESIASNWEVTLVASHSVEFLDTGIRNESASQVVRDPNGFISIKQLPQLSEQQENVISERLGLTPAALVNLTSIFVLVEGPHDELVLRHYFDELCRKFRIQILPMVGTRGIKNLVTSDFLFTATSSPIAIIVDNGKQASIDKLMARLRTTNNQSERFSIAHQNLKEFDSKEMKEIYGLIQQAIKADRLDRIHPCALSEGDILRYLPMDYICPEFKSWNDLDAEFLASQGRIHFKEGDGKIKKEWITKLGGSVTIPTIRQVLKRCSAENMATPEDILQLRFKLEELIRNPRHLN